MVTRRRRILILLAIMLVTWVCAVAMRMVFSRIDYDRVLRGERPMFARQSVFLADGGTTIYQGVGYKLTALYRFHAENPLPTGYDRGPILTYQMNWLLFPQSDRSDITFERFKPR